MRCSSHLFWLCVCGTYTYTSNSEPVNYHFKSCEFRTRSTDTPVCFDMLVCSADGVVCSFYALFVFLFKLAIIDGNSSIVLNIVREVLPHSDTLHYVCVACSFHARSLARSLALTFVAFYDESQHQV